MAVKKQRAAGTDLHVIEMAANGAENNSPSSRKDKDTLHHTRHGVLTRHPLQTLVRQGENLRHLRKIERDLRAELKPTGPVADMLFDRMFASLLRCLLAAKLEASAFTLRDPQAAGGVGRATTPCISSEELPTLIFADAPIPDLVYPAGDLFSRLGLVQKYDAHFSREVLRSLGLLLVMKNAGEAGLAKDIGKSLGKHRDPGEAEHA